MRNNESTIGTGNSDATTDQKHCDVFGWATLGPSPTISIPEKMDIEDIPHDDLIAALRTELRDRGFSSEQLDQMHIEVDYVEEHFSN